MGYIHIYVWEVLDWLPYKGSLSADIRKLGISIHVCQVSTLLEILRNISKSKLEQRHSQLIAVRHSHFTYVGVLQQNGNFLQDPCGSKLHVEHSLVSS